MAAIDAGCALVRHLGHPASRQLDGHGDRARGGRQNQGALGQRRSAIYSQHYRGTGFCRARALNLPPHRQSYVLPKLRVGEPAVAGVLGRYASSSLSDRALRPSLGDLHRPCGRWSCRCVRSNGPTPRHLQDAACHRDASSPVVSASRIISISGRSKKRAVPMALGPPACGLARAARSSVTISADWRSPTEGSTPGAGGRRRGAAARRLSQMTLVSPPQRRV